LAGHSAGRAWRLLEPRHGPGAGVGDGVAAVCFRRRFRDQIARLDDGRAQKQGWVTDVEFARRLFGPARYRGDGMRLGSTALVLLAALALLGCHGCAVGSGEQAAGRIGGGG